MRYELFQTWPDHFSVGEPRLSKTHPANCHHRKGVDFIERVTPGKNGSPGQIRSPLPLGMARILLMTRCWDSYDTSQYSSALGELKTLPNTFYFATGASFLLFLVPKRPFQAKGFSGKSENIIEIYNSHTGASTSSHTSSSLSFVLPFLSGPASCKRCLGRTSGDRTCRCPQRT